MTSIHVDMIESYQESIYRAPKKKTFSTTYSGIKVSCLDTLYMESLCHLMLNERGGWSFLICRLEAT